MKPRLYALTLTMLSGELAPEGPGWYLTARCEEAKLVPRRLTAAQAEEIGRAFEGAIPVGDETIKLHPFKIVKEGSLAALEAVSEELADAEEAATKISRLRRLQSDLGGQTDKT
jgi:hypothetical protein